MCNNEEKSQSWYLIPFAFTRKTFRYWKTLNFETQKDIKFKTLLVYEISFFRNWKIELFVRVLEYMSPNKETMTKRILSKLVSTIIIENWSHWLKVSVFFDPPFINSLRCVILNSVDRFEQHLRVEKCLSLKKNVELHSFFRCTNNCTGFCISGISYIFYASFTYRQTLIRVISNKNHKMKWIFNRSLVFNK